MKRFCLGVFIALVALLLGVFANAAQAGERRFVEKDSRDSARASVPASRHAPMTLWVTNSEPKFEKQRHQAEKASAATPKERKPLTLFHFNAKHGDVFVRPVLGEVNGAQLQMAW